MRTDRSEFDRLVDMRDYARTAHETGGIVSLALFLDTPMLSFPTIYALQTVGEAAYHVGDETRQKLPHIPWRPIVIMRHRLVHDYFKIDLDLVWKAAADHAPALIAQLDPVIRSAGGATHLELP